MQQVMKLDKYTKNTVVYVAEGDAAIPTLYIKKDAPGMTPAPSTITVTVKVFGDA
jgi:hypothetical protein